MTYYEQKDELEDMKDGLLKSYDDLLKKSVAFSEKCMDLRNSFMTLDEVTNYLDSVRHDEDLKKATKVSVELLSSYINQGELVSKKSNNFVNSFREF